MGDPLAPGVRLAATGVHTHAGVRVVDLREVAFVDPVHLVAVAALAEAARRDGLGFRLRGPAQPNRARYAARMHLGEIVTQLGGEHDLPHVDETDRTEHLVEVARLATPRDVRRLAELVHNRVADLDIELAHALHQGVSEIGQNVCDHARSVGFVAAQTIPRRSELRFAVADPGVGLLRTLTRRGAESDRHAIELALSGVSRRDRPGTGLRQTVHAVTRLGGRLYLASGVSATTVSPQRRATSTGTAFIGTLVEATVPSRAADRGTMDGDEGGGQRGRTG